MLYVIYCGDETHKVASYTRWLKILSTPFNFASRCCYVWWIAGLTCCSSDLIWIVACSRKAWRHYAVAHTSTRRCKHTWTDKHVIKCLQTSTQTLIKHSFASLKVSFRSPSLDFTLPVSPFLCLQVSACLSSESCCILVDRARRRWCIQCKSRGILQSDWEAQLPVKPTVVMTIANSE